MAGGAESIRLHATAYVLESHRANAMTLFQLAKDDGFRTMVRGAIGDDWDCQATKSGVWLLRPDSDQVVLIGPGYVATDVDDEVGIHAAITAANVMPYVAPVVASSGGAVGRFVESALQRLGLHWLTSIKRAKALMPMRRSAR